MNVTTLSGAEGIVKSLKGNPLGEMETCVRDLPTVYYAVAHLHVRGPGIFALKLLLIDLGGYEDTYLSTNHQHRE